MPEKILVVEDDPLMLGALEILLLDEGYEVATAASGKEAIQRAREDHFDLVVCDIRMAEMDGIETLSNLKQQQPDSRSIVITGYASPDVPIQAIKLGVDDYLMKPFDDRQFVQSVRRSLESFRLQRLYTRGLEQQWRDFTMIIRLLVEALEEKNPHLAGHSRRLADLSRRLARALGLPRDRQEVLELASFLHDIGTLDHQQELLRRAEALASEDRIQETTAEKPEILLTSLGSLRDVFRVILYHHEWFDGSGYPQGLRGEEIPLESRILCASAAYDAMLSSQPQRQGLTASEARKAMEREAGSHFDPEVVRVMLEVLADVGNEEAASEEEDDHEETLSRERQAQLMLGLAGSYLAMGDVETSGQAYAEVLHAAPETARSLRAESLIGLALTDFHRGRLEPAAASASQACEVAAGSSSLQSGRALAVRGLVGGARGDFDAGLEALARAREIFSTWESHLEIGRALLYEARVLSGAGREEQADALLAQAVSEIERYGSQQLLRQERSLAIPLLLGSAARLGETSAPAKALQGLGFEAVSPFLADIEASLRERVMGLFSSREGSSQVPPLSLYAFGKFRVFAGGREVEDRHWKTRKSKYLFAYLALHSGRDVPDERLMDIFWPEPPPEKARQSLYAALSHMRKALEAVVPGEADRVVLARKGFYRFNVDRSFFLDVSEFERQVELGAVRQTEDRMEEAVAAFQKAESLYGGEFMEGYYGDWAIYQRDELQMRYLDLLESLMGYFFKKERFEVSNDYAGRILKVDPCHQGAHLALMRTFVVQGRPELAARQYQQCAQVMKDELNISPSPEMSELFLEIKG
ncbi:MAG: HD domain-containing phosphohydrolase [Candidatus Xenobium sp.]